jgi:hypothetical protein
VPAVLIGPTVVPLLDTGFEPFQPSAPVPPLAVQELAALVVQLSCVDWPTVNALGVAANEVMFAAGGALVTVTTAELVGLLPPGPVQVRV